MFKIISRNLFQKRTKYILNSKREKVLNKHIIQDFVATNFEAKRRFQTRLAICKFSDVTESFTAKEKDGLTFFLILDFLEAKTFPYNFLEGHNVRGNVHRPTHSVVAILATKAEFL